LPVPTITQTNATTLESSAAASYQWYFNGNAIVTGTNQTLTVDSTGVYEVAVIDANSCTGISDTFYVIAVDVAQQLIFNNVKALIIPNPNRGQFVLSLKNAPLGKAEIQIFSITGQLIQSRDYQINQADEQISFNISNIGAGMYILQMRNKDGIFVREKVIID
ncbi:MAG: T9SS type A sorting domain-containing protein, partial [Saprospiraceae bacterium]